MERECEPKESKFGRICVFCGSSQGKKTSYQDAAIELGKELVHALFSPPPSPLQWGILLLFFSFALFCFLGVIPTYSTLAPFLAHFLIRASFIRFGWLFFPDGKEGHFLVSVSTDLRWVLPEINREFLPSVLLFCLSSRYLMGFSRSGIWDCYFRMVGLACFDLHSCKCRLSGGVSFRALLACCTLVLFSLIHTHT